MFGWFNNKKKVKEEKPKLKIYDDNGEEVLVDRDYWLENFFNIKVRKNNFDAEGLYNIILDAFSYGVYEETLEATFRLIELENKSIRSMELLIEIYFKLGIYDEVVSVIESYKKEHDLNQTLYCNYAKALLELGYKQEYTDIIYEAINKYPNSKKVIEELKNILLEKTPEERSLLIEELSNIDESYVLCLYFARIEYESNNVSKGNEYILKSLKYSNYRIEVIIKASEMLFEQHQYLEFENHILNRIDPFSVTNLKMLNVLLRYYDFMRSYTEGLTLLGYMYEKKIYQKEDMKGLVDYETRFLNYRFEKENSTKFVALNENLVLGEVNYINIQHPLYYYILGKDEELMVPKNDTRAMLMLPIAIADGIKLKNDEKIYLDNMHISLLERFYKNTAMKMQISYSKDNVSIKHPNADYSDEFFAAVYEKSPKITDILTGVVKKEDDKMIIEVYVYDCIEQVRKTVYKQDFNAGDALVKKYLDEISYRYGVKIDIQLLLNEVLNKNDILELFFDFKNDSRLKKWKFTYLLDFFISNASYENLLNALSLVQFMKIYKIHIVEDYRNMIYKANVDLNNDATINKMINKVFGDSE